MARTNYKGGNKMQPKDQTVEVKQQGIKPLDLLVPTDGITAFSPSGAVVDAGGTNDSDNLVVRKLPISIQDLLFNSSSTSINPLLDSELQELIDSYAIARGYNTSVTVAKVQDYLDASAHYMAILLWLFKSQNIKNLKGYDGFDIAGLLGVRPEIAVDEDDIADYVVNGTSVNSVVVNDSAVSINNTVWSTILSVLPHIRLSAPILGQIVGLFGVDYLTTQNGASIVYQLIDSTLFTSTSAQDLLTTQQTALTNLRAADKDLADIMEFLGFSSDYAIELDFTRDQRGLTHSIVFDPEFENIRVNSAIDFGGYQANDTDRIGVYYDVNGIADFMNFDSSKELMASHILKYKLLDAWGATAATAAVGPHFRAYAWNSSSASREPRLFFPFAADFDITDTISAAMTTRHRTVVTETFMTGSGYLPIKYFGSFRQLALGGVATFDPDSITDVFEGFNTYHFDVEGMKFYRLAKLAEMWMNGVEYRTALQKLTNSIRPMSVSKQS